MDQAVELQSRRVWMDLVIKTAGTSTNDDRTAERLEADAVQRKTRVYAAEAARQEAVLVTFQLTTEGGWGQQALRFAQDIATEANVMRCRDLDLEHMFMRRVARALQQANGDIMRKARRLLGEPYGPPPL